MQRENFSGDMSIWLKEEWNPGEVKILMLAIFCEFFS